MSSPLTTKAAHGVLGFDTTSMRTCYSKNHDRKVSVRQQLACSTQMERGQTEQLSGESGGESGRERLKE